MAGKGPDERADMEQETAAECVPEWCEQGGPEHDDVCDNAPMPPMTKRQFIEYQEAAGKHAIDAYRIMLGEDFEPDEVAEMAVEEVNEIATCMAGVGSCGRGWCRHD